MHLGFMNKKRILLALPLSSTLLIGFFAFVGNTSTKVVEAAGEIGYDTSELPTTIDLKDNTSSEIRSYYSGLSSLSESERQGTNLLKNLKTILKNGQKYYSYDTDNSGLKIWQMYEIVDRDWEKSPAGSDTYGTYNPSTNKITGYEYGTSKNSPKNNPYLHSLYVDREVDNEMRAWLYNGEVSHGDNKLWAIDREHIWQKSQGFETKAKGGARGDPMHLWSGDSYVNSALHNDQFFGYVDMDKNPTQGTKFIYTLNNYLGYSLTTGSEGEKVFEPQDSDKGDIARAIFYMVARYNYLSGSDSDGIASYNPNLGLTQSSERLSAYDSTTELVGTIGVMTDLLNWHHQDPVDEFEIHRNNLLYNNYTNNRNPFIDFPEWVDFIWGTAEYDDRTYISYDSRPTGYANPGTDTINGYNQHQVIHVEEVSLNINSKDISLDEMFTLTATISPSNATNKSVVWSSSDEDVAAVSNKGVVVGNAYGTATITATSEDGNISDSCVVRVIPNSITATVNKTYFVGDMISKDDITVMSDEDIEITDFEFANDGYRFQYSDATSGGALTSKTFTNAVTYLGKSCSLTVQVQRKKFKDTRLSSDTLDRDFTGVTGNTYSSWSDKAAPNSSAVYAGNSAGSYTSIQLRNGDGGSGYYSGIVSTTSGGFISSVEVTWRSETVEGRTLKIYGKNAPFSSANDLFFEETQGTLIGTIVKGTSTSLVVDDDFEYVGVCASDGALYLSDITFNYGTIPFAKNLANYVMFEDTAGQCKTKTDIAISYYNELSGEEKALFMSSDDYVIAQGRDRFEAWLANQGKSVDPVSNSIITIKDLNTEDSSVVIYIAIFASISSLSLLTCLVIKKRRNH